MSVSESVIESESKKINSNSKFEDYFKFNIIWYEMWII